MRVLVCGGRNYDNYEHMATVLSAIQITHDVFEVIIHGAAKGADLCADTYARRHNIPVLAFEADWKLYGRSAGPRRNKRMIEEGKPDMVIAFDGKTGTANMIDQAKRTGIELFDARSHVAAVAFVHF
jgi:SLT domain-containing protein